MVMFLMVLCMSVFGLAICGLAFGAATRGLPTGEEAPLPAAVDERLAAVPEHFFVRDAVPQRQPRPRWAPTSTEPSVFGDAAPRSLPAAAVLPKVPIEVFMAQIERHIRLEQAAAESFLSAPSLESLHGRTMSPLVH
jgi:hypothetical protein